MRGHALSAAGLHLTGLIFNAQNARTSNRACDVHFKKLSHPYFGSSLFWFEQTFPIQLREYP
ncbi:MAG: hypothetical protein QOF19_2840 [Alphaproteobacteria bacterium]|jgi:hypothetical protein|nr:hypothetical protein [Alphaproteobacteria bacterium]